MVSVWTPLGQPAIAERWFDFPAHVWLVSLPLASVVVGVALWRSLGRRRRELVPFLLCVALFLLALAGLAYSLWPYIVPRVFTLWDAASPPTTLGFILAGVLILMPFVLAYTLHTYRLFRGKAVPAARRASSGAAIFRSIVNGHLACRRLRYRVHAFPQGALNLAGSDSAGFVLTRSVENRRQPLRRRQ